MEKKEVNVSVSRQYIAFTIIILAFAFLFVAFIVWNQTPVHQSLITVSASGTVSANPAQSSIDLFLNATGNTSASAVANLSTVTGMLNATLEPFINGNSSLIQTQSYNVYLVSSCNNSTYYPQPQPVIYPVTTTYCPSPRSFYVASEYIEVTIPDSGSTNAAIIGLSEISGVYINGVSSKLTSQQQANLSQQALTLALSNATSQAQALSSGGHLTVENITVQNNYIYYAGGSVYSAAVPASKQTFFPGRATVTKSIYVVFSMH